MSVDAVIVAAGRSQRFGQADKLLADLGGIPLIERTLWAFMACEEVDQIVLVVGRGNAEALWQLADGEEGGVRIVIGGDRRRDSVEAGLHACTTDYVAIHDGARPLVTPSLIARCIAAAQGKGGAIAATPVTDTIKEVDGGRVVGSPHRSRLWAAQTPQVVRREDWLRAAALDDADETDDAAMLARLGCEVAVVESDPANLKVTHPHDLEVARLFLGAPGKR